MDVDRPSSSTPLLPGGGKGAPAIWLERLCICFIGAAATAPVSFLIFFRIDFRGPLRWKVKWRGVVSLFF
eukprot:1384112-Amorphochlora_amoeboformis.AAC.1